MKTECTNHLMRLISFESIYATKFEYGDPSMDIYTYRCACCLHTFQIKIKAS